MTQLPVFISYRRVDGVELAQWLRAAIQGQSIQVSRGSIVCFETISVYLDQETLAIPDWEEQHRRALAVANSLLVICTPAAKHEFTNRQDRFYDEIRWWLANRGNNVPILIVPSGQDWIPDIINERWPNAQFIDIPQHAATSNRASQERNVTKIVKSISAAASGRIDVSRNSEDSPSGETSMISPPGLCMWEKDKSFRYINCNDNYAKVAGYDSPAAMIGKTDDDMPWRSLADFFRAGDQQVISGAAPRRHVTEKEITVDGTADILVTENQLMDWRGECVGLTGYFVDITGCELVPKQAGNGSHRTTSLPAGLIEAGKGIDLGVEFGGEHLAEIEVEVLKGLLKTYSPERIVGDLNVTHGAVDEHIRSIKRKLQCVTDGDIIAVAMRSGLPLLLFGPSIIKRD